MYVLVRSGPNVIPSVQSEKYTQPSQNAKRSVVIRTSGSSDEDENTPYRLESRIPLKSSAAAAQKFNLFYIFDHFEKVFR